MFMLNLFACHIQNYVYAQSLWSSLQSSTAETDFDQILFVVIFSPYLIFKNMYSVVSNLMVNLHKAKSFNCLTIRSNDFNRILLKPTLQTKSA